MYLLNELNVVLCCLNMCIKSIYLQRFIYCAALRNDDDDVDDDGHWNEYIGGKKKWIAMCGKIISIDRVETFAYNYEYHWSTSLLCTVEIHLSF